MTFECIASIVCVVLSLLVFGLLLLSSELDKRREKQAARIRNRYEVLERWGKRS